MSYGKLGLIKTKGDKPIFVLLDKDNNVQTVIPNIHYWLWERIGHPINLYICDKHWQLTDCQGDEV